MVYTKYRYRTSQHCSVRQVGTPLFFGSTIEIDLSRQIPRREMAMVMSGVLGADEETNKSACLKIA